MRVHIGHGQAEVAPVGRSRGRRGLTRLFGAARWALHPDGRALFVPAGAHVADDLTPLVGTWHTVGDTIAVTAHRAPLPTRAATVTGILHGGSFTGRYELVDGDDVHVHTVAVALTEDPDAVAAAGVREIGGVPVPVRLAGAMSGTCGGARFGPLEIELSLCEAVEGAEQPLEVLLGPSDHLAVGGMLWITSAPGLTEEDTGRFGLTARDGRIEATVDADTDAALGVSFTAPTAGAFHVDRPGFTPPPIPGLEGAGLPVAARRARLEVHVTRDAAGVHAEGTVHAHGRLPAVAVDLDATLHARGPLPDVLDDAGFHRLWSA
jgi:hypothetical protein